MRYKVRCIAQALLFFAAIAGNAQDNYLDATFGTDGIATAELLEPTSLALQQDGKILVSSFSGNGIIYRFTADGMPDTGFGTNGKVVIPNVLALLDVVELPDGKILALGYDKIVAPQPIGTRHRTNFIRLNSDGSPDTGFSSTGRKFYNLPNAIPTKMKLLDDGNVYVLASSSIAKFNPETGLIPTFYEGGYSSWGDFAGKFKCVELFDNGNLAALFEGGDVHPLYKFDSDGNPLPGAFLIELGSSADVVHDLKIVENNKLLITGSRAGNSREGILLRLNNNGSPDITFGTGGHYVLPNNSGQDEAAMESLVLANGLIASGCQFLANGLDFGLSLTTASGTPYASAGSNGKIIINRPGNQKLKFIAQQAEGKIVAAGFDESSMVLMRLDISNVLKNTAFKEKRVSVYPNPANDTVNISGLPDATFVALYAISGQKLQEAAINGDTQLNLNGLAPGLYLINTAVGSFKIVKQ